MKTTNTLWLMLLSAALFSGCSKETSQEMLQTGTVKLKAILEDPGTTKIGDSWSGTERVGVYMIEPNSSAIVNEIANKEFSVSPGSGSDMQPIAGELHYPVDGSAVKFIAYYPYTTSVAEGLYKIDLTDTQITDHDLLYAKTENPYTSSMADAVPLTFVHRLAKLILNVKVQKKNESNQLVTEPATGWTASISRKTKADFNLLNGELKNITASGILPMASLGATAESIILPGAEGYVTILYDGKRYDWDTSDIEFLQGVQYTYTITLKPTATEEVEPVIVKLESTINDWTKESHDMELDETPEGLPEKGGDYTGNLDLETFTRSISAYLSFVKINNVQYQAMKLGSSSSLANCQSTPIGAGRTWLSFYAVSWTGKTGKLKITLNNGGTINGSKSVQIEPMANSGATGTGSIYSLSVTDADFYQFQLTGVTDQTTLTFETVADASDKRAIFFGVKVE